MRTERFFHNSLMTVIAQMTGMLFNFAVRTVFIYTLGMEYMGIAGLFSNVLSMLSLAELGLGTVLQYSMYKPMAERDEGKLLALLQLYKKAYSVIALSITVIGLALIPFIPAMIEGDYPEEKILVYYLLFLVNTVSSYFLGYKQTVLTADQKIYITSVYQTVYHIVKCSLQIFMLIFTRSFIAYLLTETITNCVKNILLRIRIDKMYPFLKRKGKYGLDPDEKKSITKNVYAMFYHMVGLRVVSSTDNIVISSRVGLVVEGIYDNHMLVVNVASNFLGYIFTALLSEIGNIVAVENREKIYRSFSYLYFAGFWIYSFCSVCLAVLLEPVMALWLGKENAFGWQITILLAVQFWVMGIRKVPIIYKEVMGLMWQDRYVPIAEAALNLGISVWLVGRIGVPGVVIGTIVSVVLTSLWIEPYVLYKNGFQRPVKEFWIKFIRYLITFLVISFAVIFLCGRIESDGLAGFAAKGMTILFVFHIMVVLLFCREAEFLDLFRIGKQFLKRVLKIEKK